jgi:hypothetical protein
MLKIITFGLILFFVGCGTGSDTKKLRSSSIDTIKNHIYINEVLSANANTNIDPDFKEFSDWIELYNDQNSTIDISGYHLSDSKKNPTKWKFPDNTTLKPYSYILVWADGKNIKKDALHTNFKLSQKGERVILSDRDGNYIDDIEFSAQEADISCKSVNGNEVYMNPTPNRVNSKIYTDLSRSKKPTFSLKSGFYKCEQIVELSSDGEIYYTLDGSHPTKESLHYNSPIIIDKTTVIRAISIEDGKFQSLSSSQTYLIDENITLPVMSISMDEKYLYDDKIGIYKNFKEDWMRPANIEFIKDGESKFSEGVGIRIHGGYSREFSQKSFSIFFKNRYGEKSLNYPLFIDKPRIEKVKSFMLRNSGHDWKYTMIRDAITHSLAKEIGDIDYLSYEPVVIFLNGEYYGLLNLREQPNSNYLKYNYNIDKNKINLIKEDLKPIVQNGDNSSFKHIISYLKNNSLANYEDYKLISDQIDIDELTNYIILQSYIGNSDTLNNNTKEWSINNQYKWRWMLYDTDYSFALTSRIALTNVNFNTFDYLINKKNSNTSFIFRSLLENSNFKDIFVSRYEELLDTIFMPKNINQKIITIKNKISPEIPRHLKKWFGEERTYEDWESDVEELYNYSNARNEVVREQLKEMF